jgi:hypothetical protein
MWRVPSALAALRFVSAALRTRLPTSPAPHGHAHARMAAVRQRLLSAHMPLQARRVPARGRAPTRTPHRTGARRRCARGRAASRSEVALGDAHVLKAANSDMPKGCVRTRTNACARTHTRTHTQTHTHAHTHMHRHTPTNTQTQNHTNTHARTRAHTMRARSTLPCAERAALEHADALAPARARAGAVDRRAALAAERVGREVEPLQLRNRGATVPAGTWRCPPCARGGATGSGAAFGL